jgi:mono/diheme cytochrome c family protein
MRVPALFGIVLLIIETARAFAANAHQGEIISERWCYSCHVVSQGQKQGSTEAPPFSEIAGRENLDPGKIALYLLLPHPPMSGLNLSRTDAADLAAYIDTQKGK